MSVRMAYATSIAAMGLSLGAVSYSAHAQDAAVPVAPKPQVLTAIPIEPGKLPPGKFPKLPESRACERRDLDGLWQMKKVYEVPVGGEAAAFVSQPYQYMLYSRDDTYRQYKSSWEERSDGVVLNRLREQQPEKLQQYVLHESGVVFFYEDGVVTSAWACFIVVNPNEEFVFGQMLLMPPQGQNTTRLLKMFEQSTAMRVEKRADSIPTEVQPDSYVPPKKKRRRRRPRPAQ